VRTRRNARGTAGFAGREAGIAWRAGAGTDAPAFVLYEHTPAQLACNAYLRYSPFVKDEG
jgi:hypothetical protein